ncbi:hypothetical protein F5Y19DRAFT_177816 [Xylariaceae sp. FL1651]|nr:hypothetical protein F5Y19DRAFT_177816 [Xylariaceae sp. FL1651]
MSDQVNGIPPQSEHSMHAAFSPQPHVPSPSPNSCGCELETQRILSNVTRSSGGDTAAGSQELSSISGTLKTAHALVQHWGNLNGCPNAGSHMDVRMLCSMTDAVGVALLGHEAAVQSIIASMGRRNYVNDDGTPGAEGGAVSMPRASIGELELESLERTITVQESLKHSILRLAAMLQDIEEEATWMTRGEVEPPFRDRNVKELTTRLFRLLGMTNRIVAAND